MRSNYSNSTTLLTGINITSWSGTTILYTLNYAFFIGGNANVLQNTFNVIAIFESWKHEIKNNSLTELIHNNTKHYDSIGYFRLLLPMRRLNHFVSFFNDSTISAIKSAFCFRCASDLRESSTEHTALNFLFKRCWRSPKPQFQPQFQSYISESDWLQQHPYSIRSNWIICKTLERKICHVLFQPFSGVCEKCVTQFYYLSIDIKQLSIGVTVLDILNVNWIRERLQTTKYIGISEFSSI